MRYELSVLLPFSGFRDLYAFENFLFVQNELRMANGKWKRNDLKWEISSLELTTISFVFVSEVGLFVAELKLYFQKWKTNALNRIK